MIIIKTLTQNGSNKCNSYNSKIKHINQIIMQRKKKKSNDYNANLDA